MKCDELKAYKADVTIPVYGTIADAQVYLKYEVDEAIAELKGEVNNLLMQNRELCQALQVMYSAEEYMKLQADNAELKAKLEDAKATAYAESVDAGMRERRLRRALYKACANWAHHRVFVRFKTNEKAWDEMERKCRAKAESYL